MSPKPKDRGIMVAVGAVIRDEAGRVLVVRHKPERKGYWQGLWICPGGRLEPDETMAQGVLREVKEETHLDVVLERMLPPFETVVRRDGELTLHVVYIDYLAEAVDGRLEPDDDVGEAEWWDVETLAERWEELHADTRRLMALAGYEAGPFEAGVSRVDEG
ncbi:MAG: NUDIX hydrolase [Proteobacteria bacterium]|nr:NUDIX hydrolase [Pseudomonadota bacterium]